jgi:hypothetical protein
MISAAVSPVGQPDRFSFQQDSNLPVALRGLEQYDLTGRRLLLLVVTHLSSPPLLRIAPAEPAVGRRSPAAVRAEIPTLPRPMQPPRNRSERTPVESGLGRRFGEQHQARGQARTWAFPAPFPPLFHSARVRRRRAATLAHCGPRETAPHRTGISKTPHPSSACSTTAIRTTHAVLRNFGMTTAVFVPARWASGDAWSDDRLRRRHCLSRPPFPGVLSQLSVCLLLKLFCRMLATK